MTTNAANFNWTPDRLQALRELYQDNTAEVVAEQIGGTVSAIYNKAYKMGLSKSEAFKASERSGRIYRGQQNPAMTMTQFKAGNAAWNKGQPGSTGLHPNCRPTQFKAGRPAHEARNYVPIGSYRVNKDGHLEQKLTDDPHLVPARRWIPVYRLVWEAKHGPVPQGHIVVFKSGLKTAELAHITQDRLECITRAQNAQRNHPKNHNPELFKLYQLKGAITRQVNRITSEAREARHAD